MKVMLLAAGLGRRLLPLTANTPKSLLNIHGTTLLATLIRQLSKSGFKDIVINTSRFHDLFVVAIGNGSDYGVAINYSYEGFDPLDTAGGIRNALPLLGNSPFLIVNTDIYTDYDFSKLRNMSNLKSLAHLVLVRNPEHNSQGDFTLTEDKVSCSQVNRFTFSGISIAQPALIAESVEDGLGALYQKNTEKLTAELHEGQWIDAGTPQRFEMILNCWSAK